jgi:hypothetical protein
MSVPKKAFYGLAALAIVFSITMAATQIGITLLPILIAAPGAAGLCGALLLLFRDSIAADRDDLRELRRQELDIAFQSHAANRLFDKQAAFAEEYAATVNRIVSELFGDGPSKKGGTYYAELRLIREKHSPWVTTKISKGLEPFEQRLFDMAAAWERHQAGGENRMTHYDEAERLWLSFFHLSSRNGDSDQLEKTGKANVIESLQQALGISSMNLIQTAFLEVKRP